MNARAIAAVGLLLSAQAALAADLIVLPDPAVPGRYGASFAVQFSEGGQFIPNWDFVSPVDGTFSFAARSQGVAFIGYQFDHGPIVFTSDIEIGAQGIPITAGLHNLLIGLQAAPQVPPRQPATSGFTGSITIQALPVPEAQTWVMLLVGLVTMGLVVRPRSALGA